MVPRVKRLTELLDEKKLRAQRALEDEVRACGAFVDSLGPAPPLTDPCVTVEQCGDFVKAVCEWQGPDFFSGGSLHDRRATP